MGWDGWLLEEPWAMSQPDKLKNPFRTTLAPVRQLKAIQESSIQHIAPSTYTPECPGGTMSPGTLPALESRLSLVHSFNTLSISCRPSSVERNCFVPKPL